MIQNYKFVRPAFLIAGRRITTLILSLGSIGFQSVLLSLAVFPHYFLKSCHNTTSALEKLVEILIGQTFIG